MNYKSGRPKGSRPAFTIYSLGDFGVLQNRYIVRTPQPRLTTYLQGLHVGQARLTTYLQGLHVGQA